MYFDYQNKIHPMKIVLTLLIFLANIHFIFCQSEIGNIGVVQNDFGIVLYDGHKSKLTFNLPCECDTTILEIINADIIESNKNEVVILTNARPGGLVNT